MSRMVRVRRDKVPPVRQVVSTSTRLDGRGGTMYELGLDCGHIVQRRESLVSARCSECLKNRKWTNVLGVGRG